MRHHVNEPAVRTTLHTQAEMPLESSVYNFSVTNLSKEMNREITNMSVKHRYPMSFISELTMGTNRDKKTQAENMYSKPFYKLTMGYNTTIPH